MHVFAAGRGVDLATPACGCSQTQYATGCAPVTNAVCTSAPLASATVGRESAKTELRVDIIASEMTRRHGDPRRALPPQGESAWSSQEPCWLGYGGCRWAAVCQRPHEQSLRRVLVGNASQDRSRVGKGGASQLQRGRWAGNRWPVTLGLACCLRRASGCDPSKLRRRHHGVNAKPSLRTRLGGAGGESGEIGAAFALARWRRGAHDRRTHPRIEVGALPCGEQSD